MSSADASLRAEEVSVSFGGVRALQNVTLVLEETEILGLIGPNGAGKTTLVNVLTGFQLSDRGKVVVGGISLSGRPPHHFARHGVARTFQSGRVFGRLTVFENIEVAGLASRLSRRRARRQAGELIDFMGLSSYASARASTLPFGDERRLEIARALATSPSFLLLDEPAAGMNEVEGGDLVSKVRHIRDHRKCAILVIEHDMAVIMQLCDRVHVLDHGKTIALGSPDQIRHDPKVIAAYLGEPAEL
ncbi:MAG: ABC transporter ATP-binding protein [Dehalococcoidia bacterium]